MQNPRKEIWFRLLSTESQSWLLAALFVNGTIILYTTYVTLKTFSLSPDDSAFQISAQLFSQGKIAIPSPNLRTFSMFSVVLTMVLFMANTHLVGQFFLP